MNNLKKLLEQCPIQFDEKELEKREKAVKANFTPTESIYYGNKLKLFSDYQEKLKKGFKHAPEAFKTALNGGITITYTLPPKLAKERLEQLLTRLREAYQAELEEKQKVWIDEQLAELLEQEKQAALKAQEEAQEQYKLQLLEALKNEN